MQSISSALIEYLKTIPGITALVGAGTAARIYKLNIKQDVQLPFIRIEVFEGLAAETLTSQAGVAQNRIQIDAYGATSDQAFQLAENIRLAPLQRYRGMMDQVFVMGVNGDSSYEEGSDPPPKGSRQIRYFVSRDYDIFYAEATALT